MEQAILFLVTVRQKLLYTRMQTEPLLRSVYKEITGDETTENVWDALSPGLEERDILILREIAGLLGRSDAETQRSQLDEAMMRLQRNLPDAREKSPAAERLSLTVGTMAGLSLVILLL